MRGFHHSLESLKENLRKLLNIDEDNERKLLHQDLEQVSIASAMLRIPEFQFFHIAYHQWFGKEIENRRLEPIFADYIFDDRVPFWVRHLARKVITRFEQQSLDPCEFNISFPVVSRRRKVEGVLYSIIVLLVIIVFVFSVLNTPFLF